MSRFSLTRSVKILVAASLGAVAIVKAPPLLGLRAATIKSTLTQASQAVQTVPLGVERFGAKPGEKGATYYWLEGRVTRVTTRFADAIAVSERTADGDLQSHITDISGNELGRLHVDRIDDASHVIHYASVKGDAIQAMGRTGVKPTLDWANQQAYTLWRDGVKSGAQLEWQGALMRPRGAPARSTEEDIRSLDVEWPDGLSATAERRMADGSAVIPGRAFHGAVIVAHLKRNGTDLGVSNWFPSEQVFLWKLPGLSEGYLDSATLKPIGGWRFQPDIFWVNLQTLAFHHFKTLLNERGVVAERRTGALERLAGLLEATLHANESGCDDLHWLDGTIYRYCCDSHDLCYAKSGCSSYSWWQWWTSWSCDSCNAMVVYCFISTTKIFYPSGY